MKKIILTEGTEFEQNMKDMALIDTDFREGKPTMLDSDEVNTAFSNSDQAVKDKFNFDLNGEEISITPSTSQQVITPSSGKNAITKATVAAVTSAIDSNITAENIKKDVEILGVTGTLESGGEPTYVDIDAEHEYKEIHLKASIDESTGYTTEIRIPATEELVSAYEEVVEDSYEDFPFIYCSGETPTEFITISANPDSDTLYYDFKYHDDYGHSVRVGQLSIYYNDVDNVFIMTFLSYFTNTFSIKYGIHRSQQLYVYSDYAERYLFPMMGFEAKPEDIITPVQP